MKENFQKTIIIIISSLLLANTFHIMISENFNIGLLPLVSFSVFLMLYGIFFNKIRKRKIISTFIICLTLFFAIFSIGLYTYGNRNTADYKEDAVIVLGCGIDGEKVTTKLEYRLDKAVDYHKRNPDAYIVVSGGQGPQEAITEAAAMKKYLVDNGVTSDKILTEEKATSTQENFLYSKYLLEQELSEEFNVVFITSKYHIYRAEKIARELGLKFTYIGSPIDIHTVSVNYSREILAILAMLFSK